MVIISYIDTQKSIPLSEEELEDIKLKRLFSNGDDDEEEPSYKMEYGKAISVVDLDKNICFFETETQVKMEFLKPEYMEEDLDNFLMLHLDIYDIIEYYEKYCPEKVIKKLGELENIV